MRRVEDVTEALWGTRVSSGTVSRLNQRIDEQIDAWRPRPITGSYPYVYLDGVSLKRSWGGEVRNVSVRIAIGVGADGYRHILGVAEGEKEDLDGWRGFLRHLKTRGLKGVQLIISDACVGLVEAAAECYPKARWQRCVVHGYRNVFSHVPRGQLDVVARMLQAIHAQEDRKAAAAKAKTIVAKLTALTLRTAAALVRETVSQTLTYYAFPSTHWRQIRTNNPLERMSRGGAAPYPCRRGVSRWPVRLDAGRGAAPAYRGHEVGHETLSHRRTTADHAATTISRVITQTEATSPKSAKETLRHQPLNADAHAAIHEAHERVLEEAGEPRSHGGALHRVLQLDEDSQDAADESSASCRAYGSPVGHGRRGEAYRGRRSGSADRSTKLRHYPTRNGLDSRLCPR